MSIPRTRCLPHNTVLSETGGAKYTGYSDIDKAPEGGCEDVGVGVAF